MKTLISISLVLLSSTAYAQPKADKAAPSPADKKAGPPKPAQEFADFSKAMSGTWKCTGTGENDGKQVDMKATVANKTDGNGFWVKSTYSVTTAKGSFKFEAATSYDAASKKMWRALLYPMGGHGTMTAAWGDGKLSWEGDAHWVDAGDVKIRETEELKGKELHVVGEYSKDGGKTWNKDHDATCKK